MAETATAEVVETQTDGLPESDAAPFVPEPGIETPEKLAALVTGAKVPTAEDKSRAAYEQAVKMNKRPEPEVVSTPAPEAKAAEKPKVEEKAAPVVESTPEQRLLEVQWKSALERDGYTEADLSAMNADQVKRIGKAASKRQRDYDKTFAKLKGTGNSSISDLAGDNTDHQTARTNRAVVEGQTTDGDNTAQDAGLNLDGLVLDDTEKAQITKAVNARLNAERQQTQQAMQALVIGRYESAVEALKTEFPGLSEESHLGDIADCIKTLDPYNSAATTSQSDTVKLVRKACYVHFGPAIRQQAQHDLIEQHRQQLNGQPDLSGVTPPPAKTAKTSEDRSRLAYEATLKYPNNPLEARKWLDERLR